MLLGRCTQKLAKRSWISKQSQDFIWVSWDVLVAWKTTVNARGETTAGVAILPNGIIEVQPSLNDKLKRH